MWIFYCSYDSDVTLVALASRGNLSSYPRKSFNGSINWYVVLLYLGSLLGIFYCPQLLIIFAHFGDTDPQG